MLGIWIFFALGTFVFAQQNDPLKQFCRLHSHQTTVVDRKLYIDGGLVNWAPFSADSINYTSKSAYGPSCIAVIAYIRIRYMAAERTSRRR